MTAVIFVQDCLPGWGLLRWVGTSSPWRALSAFTGFAGYLLIRRIPGESATHGGCVRRGDSVGAGAMRPVELAGFRGTPLALGLAMVFGPRGSAWEGMITAGAGAAESLSWNGEASKRPRDDGARAVVGLGLLGVAVLPRRWSSFPDGLASVAESQGFLSEADPYGVSFRL
jgi:hypothetical protein